MYQRHALFSSFQRKLAGNVILIRDDHRQALDDICNFATNKALPLPLHDFSRDFEKPFLDKQSSMIGAVMLLEHPGIGKSLWQLFVLVLRILAGRPTIYHFEPEICYVFDADGLYEVNFGTIGGLQSLGRWQFNKAVSPQYWCLGNSSQTVRDVPPFLASLRVFLVQSTSPHIERIEWRKKYDYVAIPYLMKNWSLSELIMG
ncbi:hypothetical protein PILCRDRAFT_2664 [Piloderma croceum F 1598]|uniref:Uncharacterized protein n=1 Tax=Piloderma croceum (strain F 1598) TaxID=765440 RepID=A0A0C3FYW1_PILCF|nr:hypothetical protein PILCRDRAFT_2664 [Piloderma croceum F 1598]